MKAGINSDSLNSRLDPRTIEAVWEDHLAQCKRCGFVVFDQPVTLANCCPEGSQYIKVLLEKRALPELAKKKKADAARAKNMRGDFYGTKKQVKSLMKFK